MNEESAITVKDARHFCARLLDRDEGGLIPAALRAVSLPASWFYAGLTRLRRQAYRSGLLPVYEVEAPVISVGNLAAGGTGKTPLVEWTVKWLKAHGHSPAVISRGYGALEAGDGASGALNDEILMLKQNLPGVPQYGDGNRVRAARAAVAAGADCLVLDDGFQYLRLSRDVNIVLFNIHHLLGNRRGVLPAGLMREWPFVLRDADAIVLSHADSSHQQLVKSAINWITKRTRNIPIAQAVHRLTALAGSKGTESLDAVIGRKAFVFCGVGSPFSFLLTIKGLEVEVVLAHYLPDHFHYNAENVAGLAAAAAEAGAEVALTTQKDAVKMAAMWHGKMPLLAVGIEFAFTSGQEEIEKLLQAGVS